MKRVKNISHLKSDLTKWLLVYPKSRSISQCNSICISVMLWYPQISSNSRIIINHQTARCFVSDIFPPQTPETSPLPPLQHPLLRPCYCNDLIKLHQTDLYLYKSQVCKPLSARYRFCTFQTFKKHKWMKRTEKWRGGGGLDNDAWDPQLGPPINYELWGGRRLIALRKGVDSRWLIKMERLCVCYNRVSLTLRVCSISEFCIVSLQVSSFSLLDGSFDRPYNRILLSWTSRAIQWRWLVKIDVHREAKLQGKPSERPVL